MVQAGYRSEVARMQESALAHFRTALEEQKRSLEDRLGGVIADDENGGFVVLCLHVGGVSELVGEPVRSTGINYGEARNRTQTPGLPAWPRGPWTALRPCFMMASDLLI